MCDLAWLDEIERRAEAATPGPWEWNEAWRDENGRVWGDLFGPERSSGEWFQEHDGRFIAAARSDVPKLCQAMRELIRALEDACTVLEKPELWNLRFTHHYLTEVLGRWKHGGA